MIEQYWHKLNRIIEQDARLAEQNLICREQDHYSVFGAYEIWPMPESVEVRRLRRDHKRFHNMQNALSWCIADKYQQQHLCQEIEKLDRDLSLVKNDIDFSKKLKDKITDAGKKYHVTTRIESRQRQLEQIKRRLEICVNRAKYCQTRGFNDEIARTRRTPPHRTSRPSARKSSRAKG